MQDFEKLGSFYLGREYDPTAGKTQDGLVLYDSKDLVTHAVCVGMTGSGKTGLCIGLLEEAAIDGVPAIVIDPKGDLGNLLLQFPKLAPSDFEPWINEDDARRDGTNISEFAAKQAQLWTDGLAKWGQSKERIAKLRATSDLCIYTPGSNSGLGLSILKSFSAPTGSAKEDPELVADKVQSAVSGLLALTGIEADPLTSREHILISNLLTKAWSEDQDLDMPNLIQQIQQPPFARIGVMEVESFFPAKDRFALSMRINNLLASPSFASWMEGEPMDIQRLLYTSTGKPKISIISIAHLSDSERMFVVSLLLNEMLSWTRSQTGTTSLRAIVYMDEIFGYFPPTANPPSKKPLLTLLKQARAFGVGMVLATQNPVDLDYKGLSNCGTWFIGRLQTERDQDRLLDGLESAASQASTHLDRNQIRQLIASLGKRVFLMNNIHDSGPTLFETRWCLSYLRGPLTRTQIKSLMDPVRADALAAVNPSKTSPAPTFKETASARPVLPPDVPQAFLALRGDGEGICYQPSLLAAVQIRFTDTKMGLDEIQERYYLTPIKDDQMPVQWPEEAAEVEAHPEDLEDEPTANVAYGALAASAMKLKSYTGWQKDLVTWVYGSAALNGFRVSDLKLTSKAKESEGEFRARIQQTMREQRDRALDTLKSKYSSKFTALQEKLRKAEAAKAKEEAESSADKWNLAISVGSSILGAVLGKKKVSATSVRGVSGAARAFGKMQKGSSDVDRAEDSVEALQQMLKELEEQFQVESEALASRFDAANVQLEVVAVKPKKANIQVRYFGLVWAPYRGDEAAW
jgi:hypothetical protein